MRRTLAVSFSLCAVLAACHHGTARSTTEPPLASDRAPTEHGAPTPRAKDAEGPGETPPPTASPASTPARRSPEGLATLLTEYDRLLGAGADAATLARTRDAIDTMAAQKDAHASRLYWYTDLEQAKAAAQKSGRPILSLRLLGHLDDELSCANSRLFRIVLYANEHVSQFLRDTYVLHWSSERPVPQITLDYGDGRVVKRTITGNSAHYVLDAKGRVIDALPGMYGPAAFERGLRATLELAQRSGELSDEESAKIVAKYHTRALWALSASWKKHLERVYGETYGDYVKTAHLPDPVRWSNPLFDSLPASAVNALTYSKADMEAPSLALMQPQVQVSADWGDWSKIASKVPTEHLDAQSHALLQEKHPRKWSTREAARLDADELAKRVVRFERGLTEEETRNEFIFHGSAHAYMSKASHLSFETVNDFLYSRVFRTAKDDAWLGLMPTEALTGIDEDGIVANGTPAVVANAASHR